MNDATLFFALLVILLLLMIVIGRFVIPYIDSKIPERKAEFVYTKPAVEHEFEPNLKTLSLTSNYFLLHLLTLFSIIAIMFLIGRFYPSYEFAGIFIMIAYLIGLAKFKSSKKMQKRIFDEWEEFMVLKSESNAGRTAVIVLLLLGTQHQYVIKFWSYRDMFIVPIWIYLICLNLYGWYYFRKNEKELKMENEQ